jgi:hypothetical protein
MPSWPVFNVAAETKAPGNIASMNDMAYVGHNECGVMQSRPRSGSKDQVMWIALALHKNEDEIVRSINRNIFRQTKPKICIELAGRLDMRRQDLEMINSLWRPTAMSLE